MAWSAPAMAIAAQTKALLIFERRQADVFLEELREAALIAEAKIASHFADLRAFALERFAHSGTDP